MIIACVWRLRGGVVNHCSTFYIIVKHAAADVVPCDYSSQRSSDCVCLIACSMQSLLSIAAALAKGTDIAFPNPVGLHAYTVPM
jgi:hypothetical protein